jgi:hypothetical protein
VPAHALCQLQAWLAYMEAWIGGAAACDGWLPCKRMAKRCAGGDQPAAEAGPVPECHCRLCSAHWHPSALHIQWQTCRLHSAAVHSCTQVSRPTPLGAGAARHGYQRPCALLPLCIYCQVAPAICGLHRAISGNQQQCCCLERPVPAQPVVQVWALGAWGVCGLFWLVVHERSTCHNPG